jgi:hypothetical protein
MYKDKDKDKDSVEGLEGRLNTSANYQKRNMKGTIRL